MSQTFSQRDEEFLARNELASEDATRQVAMLRAARGGVQLVRPCTLGDGIETICEGEFAELTALFQASVDDDRWMKFVPASGAASRMFALQEDGELQRLCDNLSSFAFYGDLIDACQQTGQDLTELVNRAAFDQILATLIGTTGLNYSNLPKGLLKFHRYGTESRTSFEEHLREAAQCFRDRTGRCRLHFTVSSEHQPMFAELLGVLRPTLKGQLSVDLDVSYSVQKPSTNTLALDDDKLLRDENGNPVMRPGGHGALLENLSDLDADLVFIKNIDNICHERLAGPTQKWIAALGGYLVRMQNRLKEAVNGIETISRPIRVCGMVRNEGEPGGGPFWVRESEGEEFVQIVESAEVDMDDDKQREIFNSSTHFNPVFMAVGIRDHDGKQHHLDDFVNLDRYIFTRKVQHGRTVHVLERPGLWNGAMHHWETVFVEVPKEVFSPVKSVLDLLRDEHQEPSM